MSYIVFFQNCNVLDFIKLWAGSGFCIKIRTGRMLSIYFICFLTLTFFIEGEKGVSKLSGKQLHFKGAPFHRVIKDFMIQGGDFTAGTGSLIKIL